MQGRAHQLVWSFVVLAVWLLIIVVGGYLQTGGAQQSLEDSVRVPVIAYFIAPAFLFAVVAYWRWGRSAGLQPPEPRRSWRLIWLPMVFVTLFLAWSLLISPPPLSLVLVILLNTLLVGVSEELMFRGVLFSGIRSRVSLWSAIWLTSIVFGSVHAINGFTTGDFPSAFLQAFSAALLGIWFMALRLRTNSLFPGMLVHGLWDFSLFMMTISTGLRATHTPLPTGTPSDAGLITQFLPVILFDLPLFLYGLWLLRGIGKREQRVVAVAS